MADALRLDGKVAIITGAGRGLGRAYALLFASHGPSVVVNDIGGDLAGANADQAPAKEVVETIRKAGGRAVAHYDSIATEAGAQSLVKKALDEFGGLHIVVNNAGNFTTDSPLMETPLADFQKLWDVHLMGTINTVRAAWPTLVAQRHGRIINTSSHTAFYGFKDKLTYSTVKGAVHGFSMSLALEAADNGIQVNVIAPGAATRPVTQSVSADLDTDAFKPELVAPTVLWMASDACDCNGAVIASQAGCTSRIVIGDTNGYQSRDPTAEDIGDHADDILNIRHGANVTFPATALQRSSALIERFATLKS